MKQNNSFENYVTKFVLLYLLSEHYFEYSIYFSVYSKFTNVSIHFS